MAGRVFASAEVREMSFGTQMFLCLVIAQFYKFLMLKPGASVTEQWLTSTFLVALIVAPFVVARVPALLAIAPRVVLRRESRVELHAGGLIFHHDSVKRPLFVEWADLVRLEARGWGLRFETREGADLTSAMPSYQGQFWRARTEKPISIRYLGAWNDADALQACLQAAERCGVEVAGFDRGEAPALQPA
ncbi:MAG: hypothetical protein AAFY59_11460 [Pseudomonadota bacterium]